MNEEYEELIRSPREDLNIELKQWMEPSDKVVQAKFAKELIALRNHGGGCLIIGFIDGHPPKADPNRPSDLSAYSTDYFNSIVKRYAEPAFHCNSYLVRHPETDALYPVVVVPSGATTPVRCRADSVDGGKSIKIDTYYVRRPGPESAPPQSGAEWDVLLRRCLAGRKEELVATLSAMLSANGSGFFDARVSANESADSFAALRDFRNAAVGRLEELQKNLAPENGARLPLGRYVFSARIVGDIAELTPQEILRKLSELRRYTGWSPLYVFSRAELEPYPIEDGVIECWLGREEIRDPAHADFWRVSAGGFITLIRGHQEDGPESDQGYVGRGIEVTLPTWRFAEFILRVREFGERVVAGEFRIQLVAEWEGLASRELFSHNGRRFLRQKYVCRMPAFRKEIEIIPEEVDTVLPAVVGSVVNPLLRCFSFFEPPHSFHEEEIGKLLQREYV